MVRPTCQKGRFQKGREERPPIKKKHSIPKNFIIGRSVGSRGVENRDGARGEGAIKGGNAPLNVEFALLKVRQKYFFLN